MGLAEVACPFFLAESIEATSDCGYSAWFSTCFGQKSASQKLQMVPLRFTTLRAYGRRNHAKKNGDGSTHITPAHFVT